MQQYIGTKIINAKQMTRGEYNAYRGWQPPEGEEQNVDGYLVEYTDGGAPNTPDFAGYVSWSPKEQFDGAYRETSGLTFGLAVEALKKGKLVARAGWNGKGMFLYLIRGAELQSGLKYGFGECQGEPTFVDTICMRTATNTLVAGWLASQTDVLADDWHVIE